MLASLTIVYWCGYAGFKGTFCCFRWAVWWFGWSFILSCGGHDFIILPVDVLLFYTHRKNILFMITSKPCVCSPIFLPHIIKYCQVKGEIFQVQSITINYFLVLIPKWCYIFMGPRGARVVLVDWPRRSLLPVRYGKVVVIDNILVPMLFLQVRESSRCSHGRLRYGPT